MMQESGNFTIRTNPVDGTDKFSAIIDWGRGNITVVVDKFHSSREAFDAAMVEATKQLSKGQKPGESK